MDESNRGGMEFIDKQRADQRASMQKMWDAVLLLVSDPLEHDLGLSGEEIAQLASLCSSIFEECLKETLDSRPFDDGFEKFFALFTQKMRKASESNITLSEAAYVFVSTLEDYRKRIEENKEERRKRLPSHRTTNLAERKKKE